MVLVMTVEPGFGGQSFMADQMPKVRAGPRGGAPATAARSGSRSTAASRADTIEQCAEAGADVFVAGSAVYGADDAAAAVDELRALAARHATRLTAATSRCGRPRAWPAAVGGATRRRRGRGRWHTGDTCSGVGVIPNRR